MIISLRFTTLTAETAGPITRFLSEPTQSSTSTSDTGQFYPRVPYMTQDNTPIDRFQSSLATRPRLVPTAHFTFRAALD